MILSDADTLRTKKLLDTKMKTRASSRKQLNTVQHNLEGAAIYLKTGTGKHDDHMFASDLNLGKGSIGFIKVMDFLAIESPCNNCNLHSPFTL